MKPLNEQCTFAAAISDVAEECPATLEHVLLHLDCANLALRGHGYPDQYFHELMTAACLLLKMAKAVSDRYPQGFRS